VLLSRSIPGRGTKHCVGSKPWDVRISKERDAVTGQRDVLEGLMLKTTDVDGDRRSVNETAAGYRWVFIHATIELVSIASISHQTGALQSSSFLIVSSKSLQRVSL
jgi:hypothetical protein